LVGSGKNKVNLMPLYFWKIAKIIKREKADLVISSVQYSEGIKIYKRVSKNTFFIQVLHGSPSPVNGRLKAWAVNSVARFSKKYFDKVVTVSHQSYAINKQIFRVNCDAVIYNGTSMNVPDDETLNLKRNFDFVYVGRLYRDKNVPLIMDSLIEFHKTHPNIKVAVAGYGEQEKDFVDGKYKQDFITFFGQLSHEKVKFLLLNSRFFISMHPLEACSLAFTEAAVLGCNLIAPYTNGNNPLFFGYSFFHMADFITINGLTKDIEKAFNNYSKPSKIELDSFASTVQWKKIALKYKSLIEQTQNE
jgi:glycosyltransferase involved in cell wall biosynthesis